MTRDFLTYVGNDYWRYQSRIISSPGGKEVGGKPEESVSKNTRDFINESLFIGNNCLYFKYLFGEITFRECTSVMDMTTGSIARRRGDFGRINNRSLKTWLLLIPSEYSEKAFYEIPLEEQKQRYEKSSQVTQLLVDRGYIKLCEKVKLDKYLKDRYYEKF